MPRPNLAKHPGRWSLALGALHALLFWLSFPPVFAWPMAFVSLWPLLYIAWKTPKPARSALMVMLAAMPMWLALHWWLRDVTAPGLAVLVVYLSLYAFLFVWIAARWRMRVGEGWKFWTALPVLWIGLEMLRGAVVWHGYPWYLLGHPTISVTHYIAPLIGAYGASLCVAAISTACLAAISRRRMAHVVAGLLACIAAVPAVLMISAIFAWRGGYLGTSSWPWTNDMIVAVVQTNVPQSNRMAWAYEDKVAAMRRWTALSYEANEIAPDLIVWPETMFPGLSLNEGAVRVEREAGLVYPGGDATTEFYDALIELQGRHIGSPMLVGGIAREGLRIDIDNEGRANLDTDATFNSAFVIDGGRVAETRYDKMHLTPFGEVMPYISRFPWLERQLLAFGAGGMSFDLDAGRAPTILRTTNVDRGVMDELTVATPICFEATMPAVCRRLVFEGGERRAMLMVNLTNDGWFGKSISGRRNHMIAARWRSAELATPMVRAANTGISSFILHDGSVKSEAPPFQETILQGALPIVRGSTPYALIGDLVGWLCLAASGVLFLGAVTRRRTGPDAGRTVEGSTEGPTKEKPADRAEGAAAS